MAYKPISPKLHGLFDYGFAAVQLIAPALLKLNKTVKTEYAVAGSAFLALNALTEQPYAVKPTLSYQFHEKADRAFVAGLYMQALSKSVRSDKRALAFHLGFTALATLNLLLTDYKAGYRNS